MDGHILHTWDRPHECMPYPGAHAADDGDVFECEACGKRWVRRTVERAGRAHIDWRPMRRWDAEARWIRKHGEGA